MAFSTIGIDAYDIVSGLQVKLEAIKPKPNEDVLKHLARLTSDATQGELIGLAYVAVWRGNTAGSGYTSLDRAERIIGLIQGELAILQAKLVNECLKK